MAWNAKLVEWQNRFNEKELKSLGMYIKTQSRCDVHYDDKGKHRSIECWLAFALTPEESEKLKNEPHLFGDTENATCCNGVNEEECCMHPHRGENCGSNK